jgi:hypothetical protein
MKQLFTLFMAISVSLCAHGQTLTHPQLLHKFNKLVNDFYFCGPPGFHQVGFVATLDTLYRTSDDGKSWIPVFIAKPGDYVSSLTFKDSLQGWANAASSYIHTTDGGITWQNLKRAGYSIRYVPASGYLFSEIGPSQNFYSTDLGSTWLPNTRGVVMLFSGDSEIVATRGSHYDDISAISHDGGITWNEKTINHAIPMGIGDGLFSFGPNSLDTVYFSSDLGTTWQKRGVIKDFDCDGECCEWGYTLSPFVRGGNGVIYTYDEEFAIFFSTDTGWTWQAICLPTAYESAGGHVLMNVCEPLIYIVVGKDLFALPDRAPRSGIAISEGPNPIVRDTCSINSPSIYYISTTGYCAQFLKLDISGSPAFTMEPGYSGIYTSGDTDYHVVKYFSSQIGYDTAYLHIQYFMRCENEIHDTTITLFGQTIGTSSYELCLKQNIITASPGDTILIPVYLSGNAPLAPISITVPFQLNTNVLQPIGFDPVLTDIAVDSFSYTNGVEYVVLQSSGLNLTADTLIGYLRCIIYLSDTLETSVTLANSPGDLTNSPCATVFTCANSVKILIAGCGSQMLLNFMKFGTAYDILGITPNPAGNSVQIKLKNHGSILHYELLDALGITKKSGVVIDNQFQLNLSGLSSGNYYFRLSIEGGRPITKKIVVVR